MGTFRKQDQIPFIADTNHLKFNFYPKVVTPNNSHNINFTKNKSSFIALVNKTKTAIASGLLKKLVVARRVNLADKVDSLSLFLNLLSLYPNAMTYFWHHPKAETWIGASPESLFSIDSGKLQTMALAGTLSYRADENYQWGEKEKTEQRLVVDSILSVLNRLFDEQTIQCSETFSRRAGNLVHLCNILSVQAESYDLRQIADQLHPTPAVGGIPTSEGISFLSQNENFNRSYYTGFFGPISDKKVELFVNLRCAQITKEGLTLYVGAGITAESEAENEWEETQKKAQTLLRAIEFTDSR